MNIQFGRLLFLTLLLTGLLSAPGAAAAARTGSDAESAGPDAYVSRTLTFKNGEVSLAGSLVLPPGEGPFPAVVMLHGSAPDTRAIFWQTGDAEVFLEAGVAVFIYDKRGVGQSGGDWRRATIENLAGDAVAAVKLVGQQPEINPRQVGIFGVSQGGRLTPVAAARSGDIAFLINVTGAAVSFSQQELWSMGNGLAQLGFSERAIATGMKVMGLLFRARPLIQSGLLPLGDLYVWFDALDPFQQPADAWRQVEQPAFIAYGGQDATVPTRESLAVLQPILTRHGHPLSRLVVYPQAGHGARLGSGQWAPGHIETMTAWLEETLQGQAITKAPVESTMQDAGPRRWYGQAAVATPWYGEAAVQLPLILGFLLLAVTALLVGLWPRTSLTSDRPARLALFSSGLINVALLVSVLNVFAYLAFADANKADPAIPLATILPVLAWISLGLTIGLSFFSWRAGQHGLWSTKLRVAYAAVAAGAILFVLFLAYWNVFLPL